MSDFVAARSMTSRRDFLAEARKIIILLLFCLLLFFNIVALRFEGSIKSPPIVPSGTKNIAFNGVNCDARSIRIRQVYLESKPSQNVRRDVRSGGMRDVSLYRDNYPIAAAVFNWNKYCRRLTLKSTSKHSKISECSTFGTSNCSNGVITINRYFNATSFNRICHCRKY